MANSESQRGCVRGLSLLEVEELEGEGCTDVEDDVPAAQDENHEAQQLVLEPKIVVDPGGNALGLGHTLHGYHVIVVICAEQAWVSTEGHCESQTFVEWLVCDDPDVCMLLPGDVWACLSSKCCLEA